MRLACLVSSLVFGCASETKVIDDLDPVLVTEQTPGTTDPETDTETDDTGAQTDPDGTNPNPTLPTDVTEDEICQFAAALTITLDPYQVPNDGRVVYCHSGSGNTYTYIETDISSCLPHLNHSHDVFPTSGCDN